MTYTFECDYCHETGLESPPAIMGEFSEEWFKSSIEGGTLADHDYDPSMIVTICGTCTLEILAST